MERVFLALWPYGPAASSGAAGWLANLPPIESLVPSGLTAGGLVGAFFIMLARGVVITSSHHKAVIEAMEKNHTQAIRALNESHASSLGALTESQVKVLEIKEEQLASKEADRHYWQQSAGRERTRADEIQSTVLEKVAPMLGTTTALLKALPPTEEESGSA